MSRNVTPKPIKASGARDAHGRILDPGVGALYVHMHRENGLAHRHYVFKPWQVRALHVMLSRPMLVLYLIGVLLWGYSWSQAARVPFLQSEITRLTRDSQRLDTLSAALAEVQARYDQVQRMLGAASAEKVGSPDTARRTRDSTRSPAGLGGR